MTHRILILEDDLTFGTMLKSWFGKHGFEAVLTSSVEQAKDEISANRYTLLLSDLRLPDGDGIMLLAWIKEKKYPLPVIIMTSYGEIQSAVSAIKLGAEDFLEKPVVPDILKEKVEQVIRKYASDDAASGTSDNTPSFYDISSRNGSSSVKVYSSGKTSSSGNASSSKNASFPLKGLPKMVYGDSRIAREMLADLKTVAPTKMTVLILGESGTGKENMARLVHEFSNRHDAPFIAVDCGSLSKELAPSELFGHLKGSFTSAISDKKGVFEQANGGTVFLDEVGNLPYEVQIQLLRTLQEQVVRPVGSAKNIPVDVRIVAATNEDLDIAIEQGKFREDLYHRLNEFTIQVPPLRERKEDIPQFAAFFIEEADAELGKCVKTISPDAIHALQEHYWSGNIRELRNVIRRAVLFSTSEELTSEHLPILTPGTPKKDSDLSLKPGNEAAQIELALKRANGNKVLAAQMLRIDRKTLYNKMHLYKMKL